MVLYVGVYDPIYAVLLIYVTQAWMLLLDMVCVLDKYVFSPCIWRVFRGHILIPMSKYVSGSRISLNLLAMGKSKERNHHFLCFKIAWKYLLKVLNVHKELFRNCKRLQNYAAWLLFLIA